jgi:hypothetical protein
MRGTLKLECPGCNTKETVRVKHPSFLSPVTVSFKCSVCESRVSNVITQGKTGRGSVTVTPRLFPSDKLLAAINEPNQEESDHE